MLACFPAACTGGRLRMVRFFHLFYYSHLKTAILKEFLAVNCS